MSLLVTFIENIALCHQSNFSKMGLYDFLTNKKQSIYIHNENKTPLGRSKPLEKKVEKKFEKNMVTNICAVHL